MMKNLLVLRYGANLDGVGDTMGKNKRIVMESHTTVSSGVSLPADGLTGPVPASFRRFIHALPEEVNVFLCKFRQWFWDYWHNLIVHENCLEVNIAVKGVHYDQLRPAVA